VGRRRNPVPSPVKAAAERLGLTVLQPETLRAPESIAALRDLQPDAIVVAAYGQILRRAILDLPPLGCVNVHPSLLPKLRGASPIQAAIRDGLAETGVSIMLMNQRMDAGPILSQVTAPISPGDTAATLGERLAHLGADLLVDTLVAWQRGEITARAQDEAEATYCKPLRKEDADLDWAESAEALARACRAYTPWPGCQGYWDGRQVRFLAVEAKPAWTGPEPPGTVVLLPNARPGQAIPAIATGRGALVIHELQLAGKRPLSAAEFLRGQPGFVGARLTSKPPGE
jgi:methionyl-tRNA formyltransferase